MRLPRRATAGWARRCVRRASKSVPCTTARLAYVVVCAVVLILFRWFGMASQEQKMGLVRAHSHFVNTTGAGRLESSVARLRSKRASADSHAPATSTTEIPLVAILVPARSLAGTTDPSQLALFQHLVPSVLGTLACDHLRGVRVAFYVGYDAGDVFYDNEDHKQWIHDKYSELWRTALHYYPALKDMAGAPPLRLSRYVAMRGAPCWIWNMLSLRAYADGATHFFQLNDDNRMLNECWASNLISVLDSDGGFGVVGPRDVNNQRILTQSMVSRIHIDIFGKLYPDAFRNWYSDDWLSMVYGEAHTTMDERVVVVNSQTQGTRYKKNKEAGGWLQDEVEKGMRLVGFFRDFETKEHKKLRFQKLRPWQDLASRLSSRIAS